MSPLEVVNERMAAYNAHDLERFLATYAPDAKILQHPDFMMGAGHAHLEKIFRPLFEEQAVKVTLIHQIEKDEFVVNDERVSYGDRIVHYVSIYEVKEGLIRSIMFLGDAKRVIDPS